MRSKMHADDSARLIVRRLIIVRQLVGRIKSDQYRNEHAARFIDFMQWRCNAMKLALRAISVLAFTLATSALATQPQAREIRGAHDEMPAIVYSHHDPDGAYYGKHKLGRDPDPNVRESIINSHRFEKGAY